MTVGTESSIRPEELELRLERTKAQLLDLATMGTVITSIHEINAVLSVVMDMAVRLVNGEVGAIMLEENDALKFSISWGVSEEFVRTLIYEDGLDLPTYCYNTGKPVILNELGLKGEGGLLVDSIICLPIGTSVNKLGILMVINKAEGGNYGDEDREILEMLLNFVAVAIDNSNLIKDKLRQQKIDQEMVIAKQIQETILPTNIDNIPGVDIGAVYFPARDVGGDFYDVIKIDDTSFVVIVGDVSNKGVPAALVMSAAAGIIKTAIADNPGITVSGLAGRLNDILANEIIKEREMFVTLFFAKFDLKQNQLSYCNAGHMPGLFWDSRKGKIVELAEGGTIVGQFQGLKFKQGQQELVSGDKLFLFTDGLTEAMDAENNLFGRERAEQVFSSEIGKDPKEFCSKVKEWVDRFSEGASEDSQDDFTILQVRVN